MPEYSDLADLREELTVDDPDRRANAYGAVMSLEGDDVQVSDVLGPQPDDDTVAALVDGDVIPPRRGSDRDARPAADRDAEMLQVLREIRDLLQTDGGGA